MIAGHIFSLEGKCSCGKRLCDISFAAYDVAWVGKTDIAHTGSLTATEQGEIRGEIDRVYDLAMEGAR